MLGSTTLLTVVLLAIVVINPVSTAYKLPASYPLCEKDDPDLDKCLQNALQEVVHLLKDGIRELNVPPMDPLLITNMEVSDSAGSISLRQKFTDLVTTGISDAHIYEVRSNFNPPETIELFANCGLDKCKMDSGYEMDGNVLLLPIKGKGNCTFTFTGAKGWLGPVGHGYMKNGKMYFNVTDFKMDIYDIEDFEMNFDNLFNGDKRLGDHMNNFLNENWKSMWKELRLLFEGAFGALYAQYSRRIFDKVPFDDIFKK